MLSLSPDKLQELFNKKNNNNKIKRFITGDEPRWGQEYATVLHKCQISLFFKKLKC